jgi:hypothetical protein
VHDTGSVFSADEIRVHDAECIAVHRQVIEKALVSGAKQLRTLYATRNRERRIAKNFLTQRFRKNQRFIASFDVDIVDITVNSEQQVCRQSPWRCRPYQERCVVLAFDTKPHEHGWVFNLAIAECQLV